MHASNTNSSTVNSTASSSSPNAEQSQSSDTEKSLEDPQSKESEMEQSDLGQSQTDFERCNDIALAKDDPTSDLIENDDTLSAAIDDTTLETRYVKSIHFKLRLSTIGFIY